ncbi:MAG TPA: LysR family transcriptional regulator [Solirubrobacteraceae bacterium]|nr:LysR family transcriptional regulator [Solirubrobacteraceae bacterium]
MTDLRRLQYFVAVARERNFTRAAERLHVAQPALSRQVRLLEQELGVELLHRTTHEFELTEAGEFLLERGPGLLATADGLWRDVRTFGTGERGGVVIAYGGSASYETAPRLLQALTERFPGIAVTTAVKSVSEIVAGLRDGSIGLGLVRCAPESTDLEMRPIRRERQGVLVRRDHRLASRSGVSVADMAEDRLLIHPRDANPGHYDAVVGLCREHGFEPRVLLRTLSFDLAYTPVLRGEAVVIIGESSSSIALPKQLCWLPLSPPASFEVSLLARRHNRSPAVDRMLDAATAICQELGWI